MKQSLWKECVLKNLGLGWCLRSFSPHWDKIFNTQSWRRKALFHLTVYRGFSLRPAVSKEGGRGEGRGRRILLMAWWQKVECGQGGGKETFLGHPPRDPTLPIRLYLPTSCLAINLSCTNPLMSNMPLWSNLLPQSPTYKHKMLLGERLVINCNRWVQLVVLSNPLLFLLLNL